MSSTSTGIRPPISSVFGPDHEPVSDPPSSSLVNSPTTGAPLHLDGNSTTPPCHGTTVDERTGLPTTSGATTSTPSKAKRTGREDPEPDSCDILSCLVTCAQGVMYDGARLMRGFIGAFKRRRQYPVVRTVDRAPPDGGEGLYGCAVCGFPAIIKQIILDHVVVKHGNMWTNRAVLKAYLDLEYEPVFTALDTLPLSTSEYDEDHKTLHISYANGEKDDTLLRWYRHYRDFSLSRDPSRPTERSLHLPIYVVRKTDKRGGVLALGCRICGTPRATMGQMALHVLHTHVEVVFECDVPQCKMAPNRWTGRNSEDWLRHISICKKSSEEKNKNGQAASPTGTSAAQRKRKRKNKATFPPESSEGTPPVQPPHGSAPLNVGEPSSSASSKRYDTVKRKLKRARHTEREETVSIDQSGRLQSTPVDNHFYPTAPAQNNSFTSDYSYSHTHPANVSSSTSHTGPQMPSTLHDRHDIQSTPQPLAQPAAPAPLIPLETYLFDIHPVFWLMHDPARVQRIYIDMVASCQAHGMRILDPVAFANLWPWLVTFLPPPDFGR